jgi:hypothetical protein
MNSTMRVVGQPQYEDVCEAQRIWDVREVQRVWIMYNEQVIMDEDEQAAAQEAAAARRELKARLRDARRTEEMRQQEDPAAQRKARCHSQRHSASMVDEWMRSHGCPAA